MTLVEIALDDVAGARIAELAGAGRLELCADLGVGGLTPSVGFVEEVAATVERIPRMVLIRPRGGDFVYAEEEVRVMVRDLAALRGAATGFVVGALTPDGEVDVPALRRLLDAAEGAPVTFHRAIDSTRDLHASAEALAGLGVDRVLSAGGRRTALEGAPALRRLVDELAGRMTVLVGGGVRAANATRIVAATGATEVHLRAQTERGPRAVWRNPEQDYDGPVGATDADAVRAVVAAVAGGSA